MTINIGLVTSDALVLGCDSIASISLPYIDPFRLRPVVDKAGKPRVDKDGRFTLKFSPEDFEEIITDAWGSVTKMFEIHQMPCPVVAVTAGLAKLCDRPISSYGEEFCGLQKTRRKKLSGVKEIATEFLNFLKVHYDEHYKKSRLPPEFREGPEFLVGGFGTNDKFPSLYRLKVKQSAVIPELIDGKSGVSWNGQSDAVERFIRGYDGPLRKEIEKKIEDELQSYNENVTKRSAEIINSVLSALKVKMPANIDISLPAPAKITIPWNKYKISIGYGNLPLQEAINAVSFLVNVQSGKARFAKGVATVGGRIHLGYLTKGKNFELLNEPELVHKYTGFSDGL